MVELTIIFISISLVLFCFLIGSMRRNAQLRRLLKKISDSYENAGSDFDKLVKISKRYASMSKEDMGIINKCFQIIAKRDLLIVDISQAVKEKVIKELKEIYKGQHDHIDSIYMDLIGNHNEIVKNIIDESQMANFIKAKKELRMYRQLFNLNLERVESMENMLDSTIEIYHKEANDFTKGLKKFF